MSRNYSEQETKEIIELYLCNPSLEMVTEISVKYRKTRKSVIAKLSKEGVYKRKVYTSKTGELPITKQEIVGIIENALGCKLPGLDKTQKTTLLSLENSVSQLQKDFDVLLDEFDKANQTSRLQQDIYNHHRRTENG